MEHWLGNAAMYAYVTRAAKLLSNATCAELTEKIAVLLSEDDLLLSAKPPDADWVFVALAVLVQRGKVEKYVDPKTRAILYRPRTHAHKSRRGG